MPATSPPPPTGTKIACGVSGAWRRISIPTVPCPAITSGSSNGWTYTRPVRRATSPARAFASSKESPCRLTSAPSRRTASTLMPWVVSGMTMRAVMPRWRAARATPCAWLPAEAATTPRSASAGASRAILLYAPRTLNENTGWVSSRLSSTRLPRRPERRGMSESGVSRTSSYTRDLRTRSR